MLKKGRAKNDHFFFNLVIVTLLINAQYLRNTKFIIFDLEIKIIFCIIKVVITYSCQLEYDRISFLFHHEKQSTFNLQNV